MKPPYPLPSEATISSRPEKLSIAFSVDPAFPYLDGHFEGNPLVPAIAQIGWMLAAVEVLQGTPVSAYSLNRYKFRRPIRPGDQVHVTAEGKAGRFRTEVTVDGAVAATGKLILEVRDV